MRIFFVAFFVFFIVEVSAQSIVLYGKINEDNANELEKFILSSFSLNKPKVISIYCGESTLPFHLIKKKSFTEDVIALKSIIQGLDCNSTQIKSGQNFNGIKGQVKVRFPKKKVLTYFKNVGAIPPLDYNELSKLSNYLVTIKKEFKSTVVLLAFIKEKPIVAITSPQNGRSTNNLKIEGTATSVSTGIKKVIVQVENKGWKDATGTSIWSIDYLESNINSEFVNIQAIAIDNEGDSSMIDEQLNVKFNKIKIAPSSFAFISPNAYENVVRKCLQNGLNFSFKISVESENIDLSRLYVVFEKSNGQRLRENDIPIKRFLVSSTSQSNAGVVYCFYLSHSFLTFQSPCAINIEDDYYYYIYYLDKDNNKILTDKILIHFSSFDANYNEKDCSCD